MKKYLVFALLLLLAATTQAQQNNSPSRDTHTLTIKYLYASNLAQAAPDSLLQLEPEEAYRVTSPTIPGYTPDKAVVEGRMPDHDITDTVKYTAITHTIIVNPEITHGTVTTDPSGEVQPGLRVTVTATPDQYYELSTLWVNKKGDETQTVTLNNNVFTMPDFDVMVNATFTMLPPVIEGNITAMTICAGEALTLTAPTVVNAERQGWLICPDDSFQNAQDYTNQTLDASYNGWKLRFWASNEGGISYSNVVSITVSVIEPELTGDLYLCTQQSGTYTVGNVGNATLTWTVSDQAATVTESGRTLKVNWVTAGQQTVTLNAVNEETGCSAEVKVTVNVVSYVNSNDVQQIVAKKDNGRDYILIYPNPKENYKYQWYKDGEAITGATGQYYYQQGGLDAGAYKVYLSLNADAQGNLFGGAFTNEYVVKDPNISLSPNPVQTGESVLIVNNNGEATMSVYTLDGRLLHQQTINGTSTLNLNLAQGIYLIKLNDHQNEYIEKLIVK